MGVNWGDPGDPDYVENCGGQRQSPINVIRADTIQISKDDISDIRLSCTGDIEGKFINNGHTLKFETLDGNPIVSSKDYLSGGPLGSSKYHFLQFHLHWGYYDCPGSEHVVDNNRYSS